MDAFSTWQNASCFCSESWRSTTHPPSLASYKRQILRWEERRNPLMWCGGGSRKSHTCHPANSRMSSHDRPLLARLYQCHSHVASKFTLVFISTVNSKLDGKTYARVKQIKLK